MKHLFTFLSLAFLFSSCAKDAEESAGKPTAGDSGSKLVGRIASIPQQRKFVLIQSYGTWKVPAGSVLTTQGPDGRAANLLATGEQLGQYAAADLRSGSVEVGDGVYTAVKVPEKPEQQEESGSIIQGDLLDEATHEIPAAP